MARISLEQALLLVNVGGWHLCGGRMAKGVAPNMTVTKAEVVGDVLMLSNISEVVASVNIDRLSVEVVGEDRPRRIAFNGPFMVKQQRKKVDGGGWHEVEQIGTQLSLVNAAAQIQYEAELTERKQKADAAAKTKAEEDRRCAEEERSACLLAFFARQKEQIAGSRVVDLIGGPMGLTIKFDNGHELNIELDGGDMYDAWINVEGGGQKISLESGQCPRY